MKDKITKEKLEKYFALTKKALSVAKKNVVKGKNKEAKEINEMVSNYLSDAAHFEKEKDFINAFGALNYAHGWLDSGARLGVFNVKDDSLFTVK